MQNIPYKEIELRLHTDYSGADIRKAISNKLRINNFSFEIIKQSLDARKKPNVY